MKEAMSEKLLNIPEVAPDSVDKAMLANAQVVNDGTTVDMDDLKNALEFSGRLNIRIPKTLHCRLSREARQDGVSLNQYIIYKLAR